MPHFPYQDLHSLSMECLTNIPHTFLLLVVIAFWQNPASWVAPLCWISPMFIGQKPKRFYLINSKHLKGTQWINPCFCLCDFLKAYSLILYRECSQNCKKFEFIASICSSPPRHTFPQQELGWKHFHMKWQHFLHSLFNKNQFNTVLYGDNGMCIIMPKVHS